jgi:hypothetical protein
MEEARIYGNGADRGDLVCMCDGRRTLDYDANARLIALGPDAARLLADAMEWIDRRMHGEWEDDLAEGHTLTAAFAALGKDGA